MAKKKKINNIYALFHFKTVERLLQREPGFKSYLTSSENHVLSQRSRSRSYQQTDQKIKISYFTKAVIFELGCRSLCAFDCGKIEILKAACHVKLQWPHVPVAEPIDISVGVGNVELIITLKRALGHLELQRKMLQASIEEHQRAIKLLSE